jgi:hypothetical protein
LLALLADMHLPNDTALPVRSFCCSLGVGSRYKQLVAGKVSSQGPSRVAKAVSRRSSDKQTSVEGDKTIQQQNKRELTLSLTLSLLLKGCFGVSHGPPPVELL